MIDKYKLAFQEEAYELLAELESALLELVASPNDMDVVGRAFRSLHTIKGSGSMFGFDTIASFAHNLESAFDQLRKGELAATSDLINLALAAGDQIKSMFDEAGGGTMADPARTAGIIAELRLLTNAPDQARPAVVPVAPSANPACGPLRDWRISFRPRADLLRNGTNPLLLLRELRELGTLNLTLDTSEVPSLDHLDPERCYLTWSMVLNTSAEADAIRDVFIFVEDDCDLTIEPVSCPAARTPAPPANTTRPELHLRPSPTADERSNDQPKLAGDGLNRALARESTVRVPAGRLDHLVNLVGELVMNQARIAQAASQSGVIELANPVQELERLVAELRDDVLGIRMLPIGSIFGRFTRLIHDLSAELGKEVDLVTEGAETELDKSILDQLAEPMVHLLRNSIDHGLETTEARITSGKPRRATIRLTASHTGSDVVVRVSDDGRGIDRAAVRAKAVERQLIPHDAVLNDREILNLLVLPGFSTARQVTSVSGRGVGLDVVKRQIDALRGTLLIASEPGKGCTVSLTLPLTLAIIEGLLVQLGQDQYIIPMAAVTENVELPQEQRQRNNGRNVISVRGELVPYVDLRRLFDVEGTAPPIEKVVIVRQDELRVGLVVDRVLGTHQTVIQSMGRFFRKINVVSGATILGDGNAALILDISAVVRFADASARKDGQRK